MKKSELRRLIHNADQLIWMQASLIQKFVEDGLQPKVVPDCALPAYVIADELRRDWVQERAAFYRAWKGEAGEAPPTAKPTAKQQYHVLVEKAWSIIQGMRAVGAMPPDFSDDLRDWLAEARDAGCDSKGGA